MEFKRFYNAALKRTVRSTFPVWEKLGFHVSLNHFYEPIPDTASLHDSLWSGNSELAGLDMSEDGQIRLLSLFAEKYRDEYSGFARQPTPVAHEYYLNNNSFISVDAEILYCMVRHFKPARILEVGSGFSTFINAEAVRKNREDDSGAEADLTVIDPYPGETVSNGFPGLNKVIRSKVEDVRMDVFEELSGGDILFIDSSHVLRIGGDVQYEFLEILPRLKPGVIVHFHDIFIPMEYPREWVLKKHMFWTEQYLLQAFLAFNSSFEVLWAGSYMNVRHSERLQDAFDSYIKGTIRPGSFWIRRTK